MNDKLLIPILVINSYPPDLRVAETEHNKDTIFGLVLQGVCLLAVHICEPLTTILITHNKEMSASCLEK